MSAVGRVAGRVLLAGAAAVAAQAAVRAISRSAAGPHLERVNHRGRTVSLAAGPALAVSASVGAAAGAGSGPVALAALTAGLTGGATGLYDDIAGQRPDQRTAKGFHGHLAALREGRVTSGMVKVAGIGAASLIAAALLESSRDGRSSGGRSIGAAGRVVDTVLTAGVIAGSANLTNLLDLRPGRALKAGLAVGAPLAAGPAGALVAGPVGAAAGLLRDDLTEQVMLGDSGANALGALLGLTVARRTGRLGRAAVLAGLAALTLASERISFTKVIAATPVLRDLDGWGRLPAEPPPVHRDDIAGPAGGNGHRPGTGGAGSTPAGRAPATGTADPERTERDAPTDG